MDPWILQQVRRVSFRSVLAWAIVAAVVVAIPLANPRYLGSFLFGAHDMPVERFADLSDPGRLPWSHVRVTLSEAIDTGVMEEKVTTKHGDEVDRETTASFILIPTGGKHLLAKVPFELQSPIVGTLQPIPPEVSTHFISPPELAELMAGAHSYYLDATVPFRTFGFVYLAAAGVLALLMAIFGRRVWKWWRNPTLHPAYERVASWGDPAEVSQEIEREYLACMRPKIKNMISTENYQIWKRFFVFDVRRLDDLLWAHERITRHLALGFIPVARESQAIFAYDDRIFDCGGKHKRIQALLAELEQRVPWAVFGYSEELQGIYNKKRGEFRAAVDARRDGPPQDAATPVAEDGGAVAD